MNVYDIEVPTLQGTTTLADYEGQVLLIVNTASGCGLAPQFAELEELYKKYHEQGFSVLGFPCNQFAGQEPLTAVEAAQSCQLTYDVTFPMFGKVDVNGDNAHPLFRYLRAEAPGLLGDAIKWNFTKFLVNRHGHVIERFAPTTTPLSIEEKIKAQL